MSPKEDKHVAFWMLSHSSESLCLRPSAERSVGLLVMTAHMMRFVYAGLYDG